MVQETVHHEHDKGYRSILSHKQNFLDLLKGFIHEPWVKEIETEPDSLSLVNESFITRDYEDREADIIYRVKLKEREVIFYCLLELQSTVDYTMPLRLLQYMLEIWKNEFKNTGAEIRESSEYRLPAIIPMVLFNGAGKWTAVRNFREYQQGNEIFGKELMDFNYVLFDVKGYTEDILYEMETMIGAVFAMDQKMDEKDFIRKLRKCIRLLKKMTPDQIVEFKKWLRSICLPRVPEEKKEEFEGIIDRMEKEEGEAVTYAIEKMLDEIQNKSEKKGEIRGEIKGERIGEMKAKLEIAKAALKKGADVEFVADIAKLSIDVVRKLKEEVAN